jgi:hypothetical protein
MPCSSCGRNRTIRTPTKSEQRVESVNNLLKYKRSDFTKVRSIKDNNTINHIDAVFNYQTKNKGDIFYMLTTDVPYFTTSIEIIYEI